MCAPDPSIPTVEVLSISPRDPNPDPNARSNYWQMVWACRQARYRATYRPLKWVNRRRGRCACRASNCRWRARFSRTRSVRQRKELTNQPRKCRSDTIMARILAEKTESSLAPSPSFRRCTTFWRGTNTLSDSGRNPELTFGLLKLGLVFVRWL